MVALCGYSCWTVFHTGHNYYENLTFKGSATFLFAFNIATLELTGIGEVVATDLKLIKRSHHNEMTNKTSTQSSNMHELLSSK